MITRLYVILADCKVSTQVRGLYHDTGLIQLPSSGDTIFLNGFEFTVEKLVFDLDGNVINIKLVTIYVPEYEYFSDKIKEFKEKGWYG